MPRASRPAHLMLVNGTKRDYAEALGRGGYRVTTVESIRDVLGAKRRPDAVILELMVPDDDFAALAQAGRVDRRARAMTVIALTADSHQDAVLRAGATFCRQPCPPEDLLSLVQQTLPARAARGGPPAPRRAPRRA